ncbi:MAG: hypothetical protein WCP89_01695 [archaeon]
MHENIPKKIQYSPEEYERREKLEISSDFGEVEIDDIEDKVSEINSNLSEGEKPWRVPEQFDFFHIQEKINEILNGESIPFEQREQEVNNYIQKLGFAYGEKYWVIDRLSEDPLRTCIIKWNPMHGNFISDLEKMANLVCVR